MGFGRHVFHQIAIIVGAGILVRSLEEAGLPRGLAIGVGAAAAGAAIWFFMYRGMRREQARVEALPPDEAAAHRERRLRPAVILAPIGVAVLGVVALTAQTPQAILVALLYTGFTVWVVREWRQVKRR